ncbi:hypothetical protein FQR65_LT10531 [Abscondita terminalis]|nr:hypothetical protein FQR65_LT10531 [Abscondita terminalis]
MKERLLCGCGRCTPFTCAVLHVRAVKLQEKNDVCGGLYNDFLRMNIECFEDILSMVTLFIENAEVGDDQGSWKGPVALQRKGI